MSPGAEVIPPPPRPEASSSLAGAVRQLREGLRSGAPLPFEERLAALDALSDALLQPASGLSRSAAGLAFLAAFLRSSNLRHLIERELARPEALDRFTPAGGRKSLRLLPKGIVCHWIAGNVPLLGMFSWAISALLGNANIIRLSTRQDDLLSPLLHRLSGLSAAGRRLAEETLIVRFDRQDTEAHRHLSAAADVRVAWGGREAVEAIKALPCRWECEDIVLGPRVSLAVVDPEVMDDGMVSRLATDVAYFDQLACSSPQHIFVRGARGEEELERFVERFAAALARQAAALPRHALDFAETYRIQLDRTRLLLEGCELRRDRATQWTVALVERPHPRVACANRFVQVAPFERLEAVYPQIPENVQTVVTALPEPLAEEFTDAAARLGACRFPRPGEGNHFDVPWDGIPLVSRLTRWVLRSDPRS
jgi:hypothetical protein